MINNVLIVGAHYDDAELAAAGTAAKIIENGGHVYKITLTDNEFIDKETNVSIQKTLCKRSSAKACELLGVVELEFPTQRFGELSYDTNTMHLIEKIIAEKKIDTIIMHLGNDMQHDHEGAYEICKTAGRHCNNILMYQSNGYILEFAFTPNYFVDISEYIEKKKEALKIYEDDQKNQNNQGRLFQICIERNSVWGYGNHVMFAEGFKVIKMLD